MIKPSFQALDSRDEGILVIAHRKEKWGRYNITSAPPPLPLVNSYRRFKGQAVQSSSTAWPWRRRYCYPSKLWQLFTSQREQEIFSFPKHRDLFWGLPSLLCVVYRRYFPEIKWPGREINHWPPSNTEVKNEWSSIPLLLYMSSGHGQV